MNFSDKLSILRKRRGLSQEQLAEMLNVSRQSVSKWEAQQALPETAKIIVISNIFNVSIDTLLRDDLSLEFDDAINIVPDPLSAPVDKQPSIIFCTQCGKENAADSMFCGYCGAPFSTVREATIVSSSERHYASAIPAIQTHALTYSADFDYKKNCASCGNKLSAFRKNKIAGDMYICDDCLLQCSKLIADQIKHKSIVEIRNDIARMNQYPEFAPTHKYGNLLFDYNNRLWRANDYPIFRFQDINDFEAIDERTSQTVSYTKAKTKTKGGMGRALAGGLLFGAPGAIVGGVTGRKKSITVGKTHTSNLEYFTQLGIKLYINDISMPSISVDFITDRTAVWAAQKIVEEVNNAMGLLNIILKEKM